MQNVYSPQCQAFTSVFMAFHLCCFSIIQNYHCPLLLSSSCSTSPCHLRHCLLCFVLISSMVEIWTIAGSSLGALGMTRSTVSAPIFINGNTSDSLSSASSVNPTAHSSKIILIIFPSTRRDKCVLLKTRVM